MRSAPALLPAALTAVLVGCQPGDGPVRSAPEASAQALAEAPPAAHEGVDSAGTVALLDTSAYTRADACCTLAPAPPSLDVVDLAQLHAQRFYTDYAVGPACIRPTARETVDPNGPGVDDAAFLVMPPDSLMAVEVVRYTTRHTASLAHTGCEAFGATLRLTAPGEDGPDAPAFAARELRAFDAASGLAVDLAAAASALESARLGAPTTLPDGATVTLVGHGALPGGHRYADVTLVAPTL